MVQSTENVVKIPRLIHEKINAIYARKVELGGRYVSPREYLRGQSFQEQNKFGLDVLRSVGILLTADVSKQTRISNLSEANDAFKADATLHHKGVLFTYNKMMVDGMKLSSAGVEYTDKHSPTARDVLLPLLDHADDDIRVTAASALLASHHDKALATIHDIANNCVTEAYGSASLILTFKKVFKSYVMGLCTSDPRYPMGHPADGAENDSTESEGKS